MTKINYIWVVTNHYQNGYAMSGYFYSKKKAVSHAEVLINIAESPSSTIEFFGERRVLCHSIRFEKDNKLSLDRVDIKRELIH